MISQAELEKAIARYRARQTGAVVPDVDAAAYPAEVEVGYEGAQTPVPAAYGDAGLPDEAYRSDSELAALHNRGGDGGYHDGAAVPRGNEEPTVVGGSVSDYVAEMDSGVVEIAGEDDDR